MLIKKKINKINLRAPALYYNKLRKLEKVLNHPVLEIKEESSIHFRFFFSKIELILNSIR